MKEMMINTKRNYINYREFRDLMLDTNIDRTCVIEFDEEY
jgi:hypothetical protein